jgi:hypothetical protein
MSYVYVYNAALLCEECGEKARAELTAAGQAPADEHDENTYDSDDFPKGPYDDGGGEADSPQHCDDCHEFLENPLTADGEKYVRETIEREIIAGKRGEVSKVWEAFYSIEPESPVAVRFARMTNRMRDYANKETGELTAYAWPGGYPMFYVVGDSDVCCVKCANDASTGVDGLNGTITAGDANWEDPDLYCDGCSERIESAYAEPVESNDPATGTP